MPATPSTILITGANCKYKEQLLCFLDPAKVVKIMFILMAQSEISVCDLHRRHES